MIRIILLSFITFFVFNGCATVPVTNRAQVILISADQEKALGLSESQNILNQSNLTTNKTLAAKVEGIGSKIVAASEDAKKYEWSFYVVEADIINAFALPGGQVFFYTGILNIIENDDQIATVMGHEIAHVLARHGAERMSQQMLSNVGAQVLSTALNIPPAYQGLYSTAYGIASNLGVILPYSRKHETEADVIGINLMFKAGFDPSEAVVFWQKMSSMSGAKQPEFLSTHPADSRRITDIQNYVKTLK